MLILGCIAGGIALLIFIGGFFPIWGVHWKVSNALAGHPGTKPYDMAGWHCRPDPVKLWNRSELEEHAINVFRTNPTMSTFYFPFFALSGNN